MACRVLGIAPSTYYEAVKRAPSAREVEDHDLTGLIREVHQDSRGTYGAPRIHAELRMGLGLWIGRKRVARLMRIADIHGVSHRRKRRHRPDTATHDDLVKRQFTADGPDRVWFTDITQHRASDGWVYCCAVIDA
ncbi:MAG: IS3 family transposase, partial [Candidatus Nanopelagicales bacterium]